MKIRMLLKKEIIERIILVAVILILAFAGLGLKTNNTKTVDTMLSDTIKTLVAVSALKGAVDVIEGSRMDVGVASVEVGDVTQPVLDSLNLLWKFLVWTATFWGCLKIFITVPSFLALIFLACAIPAVFLKTLAKYFLFCAFVLSLLPFTISITGVVSKHYIEPYRVEAERDFENVHKIFSLEDWNRDELGYEWYQLRKKMNRTKENLSYLGNKTVEILKNSGFIIESMARGTLKYIIVLLLNSIVIPVVLFLLMWGLGRNILLAHEPPNGNIQLPAEIVDKT